MEFLDLLYPVIISFLTAIAVSSVVFVFLLQRWSLAGHGHAQQLKEKTVILLPFCVARPAAWFVFAESKFREIRSSSGGHAGEGYGQGHGGG